MAESDPPPKKWRKRRLTPLQKRVITFVLKHPDATQLEIASACGVKNQPMVSGILHNPNVQARMAQMMERDPALCDEAIKFKLREGLEAYVKNRSFDRNGNLVEEFKDADFHARRAYLALIGKWRGFEIIRQEISGPGGGPVEFKELDALKSMSKEELMKFVTDTDVE